MIPILKTCTQKKAGFKIDNYNSSRRLSEIIDLVNKDRTPRPYRIIRLLLNENQTSNTMTKLRRQPRHQLAKRKDTMEETAAM